MGNECKELIHIPEQPKPPELLATVISPGDTFVLDGVQWKAIGYVVPENPLCSYDSLEALVAENPCNTEQSVQIAIEGNIGNYRRLRYHTLSDLALRLATAETRHCRAEIPVLIDHLRQGDIIRRGTWEYIVTDTGEGTVTVDLTSASDNIVFRSQPPWVWSLFQLKQDKELQIVINTPPSDEAYKNHVAGIRNENQRKQSEIDGVKRLVDGRLNTPEQERHMRARLLFVLRNLAKNDMIIDSDDTWYVGGVYTNGFPREKRNISIMLIRGPEQVEELLEQDLVIHVSTFDSTTQKAIELCDVIRNPEKWLPKFVTRAQQRAWIKNFKVGDTVTDPSGNINKIIEITDSDGKITYHFEAINYHPDSTFRLGRSDLLEKRWPTLRDYSGNHTEEAWRIYEAEYLQTDALNKQRAELNQGRDIDPMATRYRVANGAIGFDVSTTNASFRDSEGKYVTIKLSDQEEDEVIMGYGNFEEPVVLQFGTTKPFYWTIDGSKTPVGYITCTTNGIITLSVRDSRCSILAEFDRDEPMFGIAFNRSMDYIPYSALVPGDTLIGPGDFRDNLRFTVKTCRQRPNGTVEIIAAVVFTQVGKPLNCDVMLEGTDYTWGDPLRVKIHIDGFTDHANVQEIPLKYGMRIDAAATIDPNYEQGLSSRTQEEELAIIDLLIAEYAQENTALTGRDFRAEYMGYSLAITYTIAILSQLRNLEPDAVVSHIKQNQQLQGLINDLYATIVNLGNMKKDIVLYAFNQQGGIDALRVLLAKTLLGKDYHTMKNNAYATKFDQSVDPHPVAATLMRLFNDLYSNYKHIQ